MSASTVNHRIRTQILLDWIWDFTPPVAARHQDILTNKTPPPPLSAPLRKSKPRSLRLWEDRPQQGLPATAGEAWGVLTAHYHWTVPRDLQTNLPLPGHWDRVCFVSQH